MCYSAVNTPLPQLKKVQNQKKIDCPRGKGDNEGGGDGFWRSKNGAGTFCYRLRNTHKNAPQGTILPHFTHKLEGQPGLKPSALMMKKIHEGDCDGKMPSEKAPVR